MTPTPEPRLRNTAAATKSSAWSPRSAAALFFWTLSVTWHTAQAASVGAPADVKDIIAIERDSSSQTDIDKVMAYFSPDAVVADFALPGWYVGTKEIRAAFAPQLAPTRSIKSHLDEINVASDGKSRARPCRSISMRS